MSMIKVEVLKKCYYGDRMRNEGSIIDYDTDDMGKDSGGNNTVMPSWAKRVCQEEEVHDTKHDVPLVSKPTTLHEMTGKNPAKVNTPNTKKKG